MFKEECQRATNRSLASPSTVRTVVVRAHLECLVTSHDQPYLAVQLVLQQAHIASTALLPFLAVLVEAEQLGTPIGKASGRMERVNGCVIVNKVGKLPYSHLERDLLILFVRLGLHLLLQLDHRLKLRVGLSLAFIALPTRTDEQCCTLHCLVAHHR